MKKLVILDRDGTLIVEKNYLSDPAGVTLLPGVIEGLQRLQSQGVLLSIVSNQSGIGRGYYSQADAEAVNQKLVELCGEHDVYFDSIFICPHTPDAGCDCRKPKPNLLLQACDHAKVLPENAVMIGDKLSDIEAGKNAGMLRVLVETGYGKEIEESHADFRAVDLIAAAAWILKR